MENLHLLEIGKNIYSFLKDFAEPLVLLVGVIAGVKLLRRKLVESHISNVVEGIQTNNRKTLLETQNLIDKYLHQIAPEEILKEDAVVLAYDDIKKLYLNSQEASSDVITSIFHLKQTLFKFKDYYSQKNKGVFTTKQFYTFLASSLEDTAFYSSQVVQLPKAVKFKKKNLINQRIRRFVSFGDYTTYQHFSQGIVKNPSSAYFIIFYQKASKPKYPPLSKAAYDIYNSEAPLIRLLYLQEIYAPPILSAPPEFLEALGVESMNLHLINFSIVRKTDLSSGAQKKQCKLFYSNTSHNFNFVEGLSRQELVKKYKDYLISTSTFDLDRAISFNKEGNETITLLFDYDYVSNLFRRNRSNLKHFMKL